MPATAVLLAACTAGPPPESIPPLNSERIEQRFGSYGIEVVRSEHGLRVSDLYSGTDTTRVTRTIAVVQFLEPVEERLADVHRDIQAGGSIGAVLKAAGWAVLKAPVCNTRLDGDPGWRELWQMMAVTPGPLAVSIYRLDATAMHDRIPYATIAEIYHPDYLQADDLPVAPACPPTQVDRLAGELARLAPP